MKNNFHSKNKFFLFISAVICITAVLSACLSSVNTTVFGTYLTIKIHGYDSSKAVKKVENLFVNFENMLSTSIPDSDISKINEALEYETVKVDSITFQLIKTAKESFELTDGAFNSAIYPLIKLWKFDSDSFNKSHSTIPNDSDIKNTLKYCSMDCFILDESTSTVTKTDSRAQIDLGGIAKGYAASYSASTLDYEDVLIDIGGEIAVKGVEKTIGVVSPFDTSKTFATTKLTNTSIATSGVYERFYTVNDINYNHILDKNGYPSGLNQSNPVVSATIIINDGAMSDVLATYCVLASYEDASILLTSLDAKALIIYKDGSYKTIGNSSQWSFNE